eukprot:TRINITY_DN3395_c0_g1_i3.p1 TRINITY_DN3395_c0_g1~~TRINITY_DN3395_c0_g1_i3.p1  ORF type:complete len:351 (+),score=19.27 TRINITY_DN3395_c0_g1_i3:167-1219(+)
MDPTTVKCKILLALFDVLLYITIVIPLFLSIFGKLQFEIGFFDCNDPSIRRQKRPSSVSKTSLLLFYFLLPLVLILIVEFGHCIQAKIKTLKLKLISALKKVYHLYVRYFLWATLNILLNDVLKVVAAVPRPHFIETCQPDCDKGVGMVKFTRSVCLGENTDSIFDAMKSWPSGHAQLAAFAAVFIIVYMEARISDEHTVMLKRWLQSVALVFPLYSSATRIHDQKHHVSDVVCGFLIGGILAVIFCWIVDLKLDNLSIEPSLNETTHLKQNSEKQKRPSRMQLIQSEFGAIEEMESEIGNTHHSMPGNMHHSLSGNMNHTLPGNSNHSVTGNMAITSSHSNHVFNINNP